MTRTRIAAALFILVTASDAAAQSPGGAATSFADTLRDLPVSANAIAFLETTRPEVIVDGFNSGGLNAGGPGRASAFLASWTQTQYRIGDVSISSPRDGTPLLFPEIAWWSQVAVTTVLMPAGMTAPGLAVAMEPHRAAARWAGTIEAIGTGGDLARASSSPGPPAISRLDDWTHASAMISGPAIDGRLGLVAGGAWTSGSRFERADRTRLREDTSSAFAHGVFTLSPARELRGLAWVQSVRVPFAQALPYQLPNATTHDRSVHVQGTFEQRAPRTAWRIFGGYTGRSRTEEREPIASFTADRLVDGPIPSLVADGDGAERRWSAGARVSPAWKSGRHALTFGGDLERISSSATASFSGTVTERVDGVPARLWHYTNAALQSNRHATLVTLFAHDRLALSPRLALDAAIRFESADAGARGAADGIRWRTWLPSARLHWNLGTPLHLRFVTGVSRSANQPMLKLLAYGDPAAPVARVFKWEGLMLSGAPVMARVGPGTGGDPDFSGINPRLQRPMTSEFAIGMEASPGHSFRLSVMGVARRESSLINVVNIGVPAASYTTFTIPDDNADLIGAADDQQLIVYNRRLESFGQDRYLLTNTPQEAATMGAVVVSGSVSTPRFSFQIGGTASASVGSGGNRGFTAIENDPDIAGELFTNPNAQTYARGRLFNDRAYTIKSTSVIRLPSMIRLGVIARYQDGQPFSRMVVVPGLNQGTEAIQAFANGRSRFTYIATIDTRLQKRVAAGPMQFDVILDAYNLLNMANEVEEYVVTGPRFREIAAVQPPRSFHVGIRALF